MKAIFYAEGLDIKPGVKLTTFQNVDVYSFIAGMLGLDAATADGSLQAPTPALTHEISKYASARGFAPGPPEIS